MLDWFRRLPSVTSSRIKIKPLNRGFLVSTIRVSGNSCRLPISPRRINPHRTPASGCLRKITHKPCAAPNCHAPGADTRKEGSRLRDHLRTQPKNGRNRTRYGGGGSRSYVQFMATPVAQLGHGQCDFLQTFGHRHCSASKGQILTNCQVGFMLNSFACKRRQSSIYLFYRP